MLFYKAWRESRTRFLLGALALAGFCIFVVWFPPVMKATSLRSRSLLYDEYIYDLICNGTAKGLFAILAIFLGLGGLLRERAHHSEVFTLSLSVSRAQLVGAHVAVGLVELALLALLPAFLIPPLSMFVHQSYSVAEALRFSLLWFSGGTVIFALSFFLSAFLRGEYTAPVACLIALMLHVRIAGWGPLRPYGLDIFRTMGARWDWYPNASQINGPLPWAVLSIMMLVAFLMFAAATRITQRQNV